jgi:tetratricopeptide (TPR) repeat protein
MIILQEALKLLVFARGNYTKSVKKVRFVMRRGSGKIILFITVCCTVISCGVGNVKSLRNDVTEKAFLIHTPAEGANLTSVARLYYGDGKMAVLLARYNNLDTEIRENLSFCMYPSGVLYYADLDLELNGKPIRIPFHPITVAEKTARRLKDDGDWWLNSGEFELAAERYKHAVEYDPAGIWLPRISELPEKLAKKIRNYQLVRKSRRSVPKKKSPLTPTQAVTQAKDSIENGNLLQASGALVGISNREANKLRREVWKLRKKRAAELYNEGLARFRVDDLEGAIAEWSEALRYNPDHPKAAKDKKRAKNMLKNLSEY